MSHIARTNCCGIKEINAITFSTKPEQTILDITYDILSGDDDAAFFFFSDIFDAAKGNALSDYIKKNKLGRCKKIGKKRNPNSNNMLTMWVWCINIRNFKSFIRKKYPDEWDDSFVEPRL